jgi:hypothetical protein
MSARLEHCAVVGVFATLLLTCGAAVAETIRPGYWESITQVTSPIESTKTERRCVTAKDVAVFMTCHINHHYKCVCPEQSYSGGRIVFRGDCVDAKSRHVHVEGEGSYSPTTLRMTARGQFKLVGLTVSFSASTQSHRIADVCPAGSPGSEPPRQ